MVKIGGASLEDVSPYFHLPIEEAARELGVCSSALKRRCRRLGIKRWPFRKVRSMSNSLSRTMEGMASVGVGPAAVVPREYLQTAQATRLAAQAAAASLINNDQTRRPLPRPFPHSFTLAGHASKQRSTPHNDGTEMQTGTLLSQRSPETKGPLVAHSAPLLSPSPTSQSGISFRQRTDPVSSPAPSSTGDRVPLLLVGDSMDPFDSFTNEVVAHPTHAGPALKEATGSMEAGDFGGDPFSVRQLPLASSNRAPDSPLPERHLAAMLTASLGAQGASRDQRSWECQGPDSKEAVVPVPYSGSGGGWEEELRLFADEMLPATEREDFPTTAGDLEHTMMMAATGINEARGEENGSARLEARPCSESLAARTPMLQLRLPRWEDLVAPANTASAAPVRLDSNEAPEDSQMGQPDALAPYAGFIPCTSSGLRQGPLTLPSSLPANSVTAGAQAARGTTGHHEAIEPTFNKAQGSFHSPEVEREAALPPQALLASQSSMFVDFPRQGSPQPYAPEAGEPGVVAPLSAVLCRGHSWPASTKASPRARTSHEEPLHSAPQDQLLMDTNGASTSKKGIPRAIAEVSMAKQEVQNGGFSVCDGSALSTKDPTLDSQTEGGDPCGAVALKEGSPVACIRLPLSAFLDSPLFLSGHSLSELLSAGGSAQHSSISEPMGVMGARACSSSVIVEEGISPETRAFLQTMGVLPSPGTAPLHSPLNLSPLLLASSLEPSLTKDMALDAG